MTSRVALIAAFVLGACFVLPLSTCTRYVDAKGEAVEVEEGETPPAGAIAIVDYQIPAEQLWTNPLGGFVMLVAFLGPLAGALHARFGRSGAREARRLLAPAAAPPRGGPRGLGGRALRRGDAGRLAGGGGGRRARALLAGGLRARRRMSPAAARPLVRPLRTGDEAAALDLVARAFGRRDEADLVRALRGGRDPLIELVAERRGRARRPHRVQPGDTRARRARSARLRPRRRSPSSPALQARRHRRRAGRARASRPAPPAASASSSCSATRATTRASASSPPPRAASAIGARPSTARSSRASSRPARRGAAAAWCASPGLRRGSDPRGSPPRRPACDPRAARCARASSTSATRWSTAS